jgi:hypothetical protein
MTQPVSEQVDARTHARHVAVQTFDRLRRDGTVSDALHGAFDAFEQVLVSAGLLIIPEAPRMPPTYEELTEAAQWLVRHCGHPRLTQVEEAWRSLLTSDAQVEFAYIQARNRNAGSPQTLEYIEGARAMLLSHIQGA